VHARAQRDRGVGGKSSPGSSAQMERAPVSKRQAGQGSSSLHSAPKREAPSVLDGEATERR